VISVSTVSTALTYPLLDQLSLVKPEENALKVVSAQWALSSPDHANLVVTRDLFPALRLSSLAGKNLSATIALKVSTAMDLPTLHVQILLTT
jgi:hypothetical protein